MKLPAILTSVLLLFGASTTTLDSVGLYNAAEDFNSLERNSVIVSCEIKTPEKYKQRRPDAPDYVAVSGTGTVIFSDIGQPWYILTAAHVVNECEREFKITWDDHDGTHNLEIVKISVDTPRDLALYKTKDFFQVKRGYVKISKEAPKLGDEIYMAGYPGVARPYFILTKGIVANHLMFMNTAGKAVKHFIIDGQITFGNSGGSCLNKKMELIGVNVQILPQMFYGYQLGIAVHTDEMWQFLKEADALLYSTLAQK